MTWINPGHEFERPLRADREHLPIVAEEVDEHYLNEPYRRKLKLIRERFRRAEDVRPSGYADASELMADLEVVDISPR